MYDFDVWSVVALVLIAPFAIGTVFYIAAMLFKVIHNIYIHIKYGLEYTDQDE